jgi:hypothetical protein
MLVLIALSSFGALQPCQKVMVTGADELPTLPAEPALLLPVQAAAVNVRAAVQANAAVARRKPALRILSKGEVVTGFLQCCSSRAGGLRRPSEGESSWMLLGRAAGLCCLDLVLRQGVLIHGPGAARRSEDIRGGGWVVATG